MRLSHCSGEGGGWTRDVWQNIDNQLEGGNAIGFHVWMEGDESYYTLDDS